MSLEDINNAANAMNALTTRVNDFMSDIDAEVAEKRAGFQSLSDDLVGVVKDQMLFSVTIDPNDENPSQVSGGVFNTIHQAIAASPAGSVVKMALVGGDHVIDGTITFDNLHVFIVKKNTAISNPILRPQAFASDTHNQLKGFAPGSFHPMSFRFHNIDIAFPTDKADPALPWSSFIALIDSSNAGSVRCYTQGCRIFCDSLPPDLPNWQFINVRVASNGMIGFFETELDGGVIGANINSTATAMVARNTLTLSNGASFTNGGTVGTTKLEV